jgi:hypothetical protein
MIGKKLTIANIQIFFDGNGVAQFSAGGKQGAAVERELADCQDFIERWLQASEEDPRPLSLSSEEIRLRSRLRSFSRGLKKLFDKDTTETWLRELLSNRPRGFEGLSQAQIDDAIVDVISKL